MATVTIGKRVFEVVATAQASDGVVYELRGARGARYATCRNANRKEFMFLVHFAPKFGIPSGFEGVWLTDEGGELRVVA